MQDQPTGADEAKAQGWHMVCVIQPANGIALTRVIDQIKGLSSEICLTSFGRSGARLNPPDIKALWIRGFDWEAGFETIILAFYSYPQLAEFCREMKRRYMPQLVLDKKQKPDANYLSLVRHQIRSVPP